MTTARDKSLTGEATSATPATDSLIATQVGDFIIQERIGSGGMGVVYRATHPLIGKQVAIKVLRAELVSEQQVERLLIEARAVNAIQHPGIIDIFGFGSLPDGRPYIIMELLHGSSLSSFIRERGHLDAETTLWILDQMLAALGAAHRAGIVHRDLKPGNVFIVRAADGASSVKLVDFGIAKLVSSSDGPTTVDGSILGTPEFMAPEQIRGAGVSPATDLYAVGVMAFQMLTGVRPFQGEPFQVLFAHIEQPPPVPSSRVPSVPPELDTLVLQLMAKDPGLRPESAEAVRRALRRSTGTGVSLQPMKLGASHPIEHPETTESQAVTAHRLSRLPSSRGRRSWAIGVTLLAALSGAGAYLLVPRPAAVPPVPVVAQQPPPAPNSPSEHTAAPALAAPAPSPSVALDNTPPKALDEPPALEDEVAAQDPTPEPQGKSLSASKPRGPQKATGGLPSRPLKTSVESDAAPKQTLDEALAMRRRAETTALNPPLVEATTTAPSRQDGPARKEVEVPRLSSFLPRSSTPPADPELMQRVYQLEESYLQLSTSRSSQFEEQLKVLHSRALEANTRTKNRQVSYALSVLTKSLNSPVPPPPAAVIPEPAPPPPPPLPIGPRLMAILSTLATTPRDAKLANRFAQLKALYLERAAHHTYPYAIPEELLRLHQASLNADTATKRMDVQRGLDAWRQALDLATPK